MKTIIIITITILFVSCANVPEKNKELAQRLNNDKTLVGTWVAQPGYQSDSIKLIHVDSVIGKINNIMRFRSNGELNMFDYDNGKNLYSCGNTTRYSDISNWKLDCNEGLLYLDIFSGAVMWSAHTKKAYRIVEIKKDTIFMILHKTLTDNTKK